MRALHHNALDAVLAQRREHTVYRVPPPGTR